MSNSIADKDQRISVTQVLRYMLSSGVMRKTILDKIGRLKGTSIKAKSARGVMALGIGTVAGRSTRFLRNMILAKFLLAPDQLGVMAIIMGFSMAFGALIEVGVKQSVIQNKRGANDDYLNVAWWMQVARGLCLFAAASLLASPISSFYDAPELSRLLRVAFLGVVLQGLISPRAYVLEKEFKFGRAVFLLQGSTILGTFVTIGLAVVMRNVWALVLGYVTEMAIMCILSYILVPFLPRFRIDRKSLSELIKYARGMIGLPILNALSIQVPVLILGKVISKEQLGLYSMAAVLALIPVDLYSRVVAPVLFPVFVERQDNYRALCRGIFLATRWTAFIAMPMMAFMACSASELLSLVYRAEYVVMAIPFAVLCVKIVVRSEATILVGMFMAIGQPHLQRRFAIMRAVLIVGLMYPAAIHYGPLGAAAVIILVNLAVLVMQVFKAREVIDLELIRYACSYIPGLLLALSIIVTFDMFWLLRINSPILVLAIGITVLVAAFVAGLFIMNRSE
jgi:PST family polysaccharide transporter/lipopolysaccharide exporter